MGLDLRGELKRRLWAHLLQNSIEQVAFAYCEVVASDPQSTTFRPRELYLVPPDDFAVQTSIHVELCDSVKERIIKHAWHTETAIVEFHSHPTDRHPAEFSWSDMSGFAEFVPHCRWRLRGRPYVAVLVNPRSVDALVWAGASQSPARLDAILSDPPGTVVPTHFTISALERKE